MYSQSLDILRRLVGRGLIFPIIKPTQEGSLRIVLLELNNLLQSFPLNEDSQRPTKSNLHNVGFEVIISKSEVEISLWVLFYAGNEGLLKEMITEHLNIFDGVLVGRHCFVQTVVIVQVILLPFLSQTYC